MKRAMHFRGLPEHQAQIFEQIAVGNSCGHSPQTLKALHKKGLIEFAERVLGQDALGLIIVNDPYVPIPIHIEWCGWCTKQLDGFEEIA